MQNNFYEIDDIIVNSDITERKFTCDLEKCKGACCTMKSDFGAPVTEKEIDKINGILHIIKEYIPERHIKEIEKNGFWEEKMGQLLLNSVNKRECVFVYYDNDIAKCGIEKAFNDGKVNFRKPISCHLFPIRISDFGGDILRFEEYKECGPALEKGLETNLSVLEFCKDSLKRIYGSDWFNKIRSLAGK